MINEKIKQSILNKAKEQLLNHPVQVITKAQHNSKTNLDDWKNANKPYNLLLDINHIFETEDLIAFYDVGYGHVLCYDKNKETLEIKRDGIFNSNYCVLGDYHGYNDYPVIFKRAIRI